MKSGLASLLALVQYQKPGKFAQSSDKRESFLGVAEEQIKNWGRDKRG